MKVHKDTFYFESFDAARRYACEHGFPTTRIIHYGLGWAIQLRISGPYVGPETDDDPYGQLLPEAPTFYYDR